MARSDGTGRSSKSIVVGILIVVLVILIAQNHNDTRVDILFFHVTWPLWVLLGGVGVLAFIAGWFAGRMRR